MVYRGDKLQLDISSAFGQWGGMQVEIVKQHSAGRSYFTEMGRYGFHHFAIFVDDLDAAISEFAVFGCEVAGYGKRPDGSYTIAMIDCREAFGIMWSSTRTATPPQKGCMVGLGALQRAGTKKLTS